MTLKSLSLRFQTVRGTFALAAAFVLHASFAASLFADFSGPYTLTPPVGSHYTNVPSGTYGTWTYSTTDLGRNFPMTSIDTLNAPTFLTLDTYYPDNDYLPENETMELTNVAAANGFFSFDYTLTVGGGADDVAAYSVNGVLTYLSHGTSSIENVPLNAGDVFGFYVNAGQQVASYGLLSRTILSVSDFTAPVPEPSGLFALGLGLAGLGLMHARTRGERYGRAAGVQRSRR